MARDVFVAALEEPVGQSVLARAGLIIPREAMVQIQASPAAASEKQLEVRELLELAAEYVIEGKRQRIDEGDLLLTLLAQDPLVQKLAFAAQLEEDELLAAIVWQRRWRDLHTEVPAYERPVGAGIAQDWTAGYTPFLSRFATNLTGQIRRSGFSGILIHGRDIEIQTLERWLGKQRGHNVLLIGEQGIGKQSIVRGLAVRIASGTDQSTLRYQQILALDLPALLAGSSDRGEIEERLLHVFSDAARAGNIILYIDDIHLLIGGGDRVGGVDATEILLNTLRSSNLYVVATTTPQEFASRISSNTAVANLFERLDVSEVSQETTLEILEDTVPMVESESGSFITVQALQEIVRLADRYLHDQPFPHKALNLLTEIGAYAHDAGTRLVGPELVQKMLSEKLKVPLQNANEGERDKLLRLEEELHKTVIAQDEAITAIAGALRRARAGLASGKRPIASLLFLGPTGVGKTESAKALARVYFGDPTSPAMAGFGGAGEDHMIRLDMSEYQQSDGLVRLLGAPATAAGVKTGGHFVDSVHDQPFSLILLDELEKAHPQILNLFLQVLDDGRLTDGTGRVIDFTNTIIIATSNAGAELIRTSIGAGEDQETRRTKLLNQLQEQGIYRPEFLNRFDGIIAFHPLSIDQVSQIASLMLSSLARKLSSEQQITVTFADDLVRALAQHGFDPQFGARPLRRLIQDSVEHYLAQRILEGKLARGQSLALTAADIGLSADT
jgi:ATP-dependent Clp protease ATP-binding subunit ClpC